MPDIPAASVHTPKSLFKIVALILVISVPLLMYGIGVMIFPTLIRAAYQSRHCDPLLSLHRVYTGAYPDFLKDDTLSAPARECEAYQLAASHMENGSWREAFDAYQAYASTYPTGLFAAEAHQQSAAALFQLAQDQIKGEKYEEALSNLNLIVGSYSDTGVINEAWELYPSVYTPWGASLRETKDFAGSEQILNDFKNWSLTNQKSDLTTTARRELTDTYLAWGLDLQSQKQYEDAIAKLDLAATTDSQSQSASAEKVKTGQNQVYIEWGNTLLDQGKFPDAISKFEQAVSKSGAANDEVNDALANGQIQWASQLSSEEDFAAALEHMESAKKAAGSEEMKKNVEAALQDTYLAFSKSSGPQARRAMKEVLKTVCEKHKAPDLPIFGLNQDSIRFGIYGVEDSLPSNVAARTPGEMHSVVCVTLDNRTIESRQHKVILFQFSRGYLYTYVEQYRVQVIWNVKLLDLETIKTVAEETLAGETPPPFSETGGNYFYGKPPLAELTAWLQSLMQ